MATLADYEVTNQWTNIVSTVPAAASADLTLQVITNDTVQVVIGGASAPAVGVSGFVLTKGDILTDNNANWWVRSFDPSAKLTLRVP